MDRIYLVGAEEVSSAGSRMSNAATEMRQAASSISESLYQQRQYLDQWLENFRVVLEENQLKRSAE